MATPNPDGHAPALASFVAKWIAVEPELGIALQFVAPERRDDEAAWACLAREIAHTTFSIRETEVAQAKLNWWHEELLRLGQGEPRHPLTQALAGHPALTEIAHLAWHAVITAAMRQSERDPAPDFAAQMAGYEQFFVPLAQIEATLFGDRDAAAIAQASALSHALREIAAISRVLDSGHLALPLDALARHQLLRDQLGHDSEAGRLASAEHLRMIAAAFEQLGVKMPRVGLIHQASRLADARRNRIAAKAQNAVSELARQLSKLSLATTWKIWRAARRGD